MQVLLTEGTAGEIMSFRVFGKVIVILDSVKATKELFERRGETPYIDNWTSTYHITDSACPITDREYSRRKGIYQDKLLAKIRSCATSSLGAILHSNISGCLQKSDCQHEAMTKTHLNSHDDPTADGHHRFHRDIVAILVFCIRHIEY
jgi:hypothetical protein